MNETPITVVGNVSDAPSERLTQSGKLVARFRIASTPRRFDKASSGYVDSDTLWLGVTCWESLARNVLASIRKGHPVIVTGRLVCREYVKDEQRRVSFEVVADAVGHNLARGTASFERAQRMVGITSVAVDAEGIPEDYPDEVLVGDVADEDDSIHGGPGVAGLPSATPLPDSGPLISLG